MKTLVCIPSYNCQLQIQRVLSKIGEDLLLKADFLIVDNASIDGTREVIKESLINMPEAPRKRFTVIAHDRNYGLGGTFKTFFDYANLKEYDFLLLFHGDDQASVNDLRTFITLLESDEYDCIFGARFIKGAKLHQYSKVREYGNRLINFIYSIFLGRNVYEIGSGLNAYRLSSLPQKEIPYFPDHIAFDINLLLHFLDQKKHYRTLFHPIEWFENDQVSNARNLQVAKDVLLMLFRYKLGIKNLLNVKSSRTYKVIES